MKRLFLALIPSALIAASCQVTLCEPEISVSDAPAFEAEAEAFDGATKTSLTTSNQVIWSKGDQISIFSHSTIGDKYRLDDASAGSPNGSFSLVIEGGNSFVAGNELPTNIALYPYTSDAAATVADGRFKIGNISLPLTQNYAERSFDNGCFYMVAVTRNLDDKSLKFRNALGALKLQLLGDCKVKSIKIEGNRSELLSGKAEIMTDSENLEPAIIMDLEASTSVILNCGGVQLDPVNATEFIIALPPVVFTEGFKVTVTDTYYKRYTLEANAENEIERSTILRMPEATLENGVLPDDISTEPIIFADEVVKERCVALYDTDGDNEVSFLEAAAVTGLNGLFNTYEIRKQLSYNSYTGEMFPYDRPYHLDSDDTAVNISSFDELEHFIGLTEIDPYAFTNCHRLKSIKLPAGIQKIGSYAFDGCDQLSSLVFPEGIKEILSIPLHISEVIVPEGATTLSGYWEIFSKEYMDIRPDMPYGSYEYTLSLPKTLNSYQLSTFFARTSEENTFNLTLSGSALANDGISYVNEDGYLFLYCGQNLQSYEIPEGVRTCGSYSLYNSNGKIKSITLPSTLTVPTSNPLGWWYNVTEVKGNFASADGKALISGEKLIAVISNVEEYTIPSEITIIGREAFSGTRIKTIDIPSTVTNLEAGAFNGCYQLTDVTLPENITSLPEGCFSGCANLENINLEKITTLGNYAFNNCKKMLARFKVPGRIKEIGFRALYSDNPGIIEFESLTPPTLNTIWELNENNALVKSTNTFSTKQSIFVPDAAYSKYSSVAFSEIWPMLDLKLLSELYNAPEINMHMDEEYVFIDSDYYGRYSLRRVRAGSYTRTSPIDMKPYVVNITKDYYIGETEVPQWLWEIIMHCNPSEFANDSWRPVNSIMGEDCLAYIAELNKLRDDYTFRLPTEAESGMAVRRRR